MKGYTKQRIGVGYPGHSIYLGENPHSKKPRAIHVVEPEDRYIRYGTNRKLIRVEMPYQVWVHKLDINRTTGAMICNGFSTRMALAQSDPMTDPNAKLFTSFMPNTSSTSFCHGDMSLLMDYMQTCRTKAAVRKFILDQYDAYWSTQFNTELEPMYWQPRGGRGLRRFFPPTWTLERMLSEKFYDEVIIRYHRNVNFNALTS